MTITDSPLFDLSFYLEIASKDAKNKIESLCPNFTKLIGNKELNGSLKSAICARDSVYNEPYFICLDCVYDNTTSLCKFCFENSEHRNHNVKITSSSGQGSCDCGDVEAWKSIYYCTDHCGKDSHSSEEVRKLVGVDFSSIVEFELPKIFDSIKDSLILKDCYNQEFSNNNDVYHLLFYNNEYHSFYDVEQYVNSFRNDQSGLYLANSIDNFKLFPVYTGSLEECKYLKELTTSNSYSEYIDSSIQTIVCSKPDFERLLMTDLILENLSNLPKLAGYVLCGYLLKIYNKDSDFYEFYVKSESSFSSRTRNFIYKLFCSYSIGYIELRAAFSKLFHKNYMKLLNNSFENYEAYYSFLIFAELQIYTARSVVLDLMSTNNIFKEFIYLYSKNFHEIKNILNKGKKESSIIKIIQKYTYPIQSMSCALKMIKNQKLSQENLIQVYESFCEFVPFLDSISKNFAAVDLTGFENSKINHLFFTLTSQLKTASRAYCSLLSEDSRIHKLAIHFIMNYISYSTDMISIHNQLENYHQDGNKISGCIYPYSYMLYIFQNLIFNNPQIKEISFLMDPNFLKSPFVRENKQLKNSFDDSYTSFYNEKFELIVESNLIDALFSYYYLYDGFIYALIFSQIRDINFYFNYSSYIINFYKFESQRKAFMKLLLTNNEDIVENLKKIQKIFRIFFKHETEYSYSNYGLMHFVCSLFYDRDIYLSEATKKDMKIENMVHFSLFKQFSFDDLLNIIKVEKSVYKPLIEEVLDIKFMHRTTFTLPKQKYISYFNPFKANSTFSLIQSAIAELIDEINNTKLDFQFKKPFMIKKKYEKLSELINSEKLHCFIIELLSSDEFFDMRQLFYIYSSYALLENGPKFRAILEIYLSKLGAIDSLSNSKSVTFFAKKFQHIYNSENESKAMENKSSSDENVKNKTASLSNKNRLSKFKKIEEMQQKYLEKNFNLMEKFQAENSKTVKNSDENLNTLFDHSEFMSYSKNALCFSCNSSSGDLYLFYSNLSPPHPSCSMKNENKFNENSQNSNIVMTCGHTFHLSCSKSSICSFCHCYIGDKKIKIDKEFSISKRNDGNKGSMTFSDYLYWIKSLVEGSIKEDILIQNEGKLQEMVLNIEKYSHFLAWKTQCFLMRKSNPMYVLTDYQVFGYHQIFTSLIKSYLVDLNEYEIFSYFLKHQDQLTHPFLSLFIVFNIVLENYYKDIGDHCANIAKLFYYAYVHMNSAKSGLETKYFLRSLAFFYSIFCQSPLSSTIEASKNLEVSLMKILDLHSDPQCLTQIIDLLSLMGLNKEYMFDCEIDFVSYAQNYDFISLPKNFSDLCWKACNINCPKTGFKTDKVLCLFCGNYICYRGICCIGPKFKDWENDCFSHHAKNKDVLALHINTGDILYYSPKLNFSSVLQDETPYFDKLGCRNRNNINSVLNEERYALLKSNFVDKTLFTRAFRVIISGNADYFEDTELLDVDEM